MGKVWIKEKNVEKRDQSKEKREDNENEALSFRKQNKEKVDEKEDNSDDIIIEKLWDEKGVRVRLAGADTLNRRAVKDSNLS